MQVKILLADDHAILRAGLQLLIESREGFVVTGQASDVASALACACEQCPDLAIIDITMPGGGVALCREITSHCTQTRVLTLTMHEDAAYMKAVFSAGASGYVLKRSADTSLLDAIDAVLAGHLYIDPAFGAQAMKDLLLHQGAEHDASDNPHGLSKREQQVLTLLSYGYTNREAADELGLSVRSIEAYRARVAERLGFEGRKDMVRFALEAGLLKPGDEV